MKEETVSIGQLFEEELDAVLEMVTALRVIRAEEQLNAEEYFEITNDIVKLEMTAEYLNDRLNDEVPPRWLDGKDLI